MSDNKKDTDPELDDLLDSALQDMTAKSDGNPADKVVVKPESSTDVPNELPANMWSEEFIKEAAAQFETNMAAILGNFSGVPEDQITQEQIAQTFSKMAEAAAQVLNPADENGESNALPDLRAPANIDEVTAAITQTLQNLNTNTENLQTPFSDQDLANMFNNFNLEAGQEGNMFVPFMQGMMQSLLSKEVLYPSLKELVEKYPSWLEENKGKIDAVEFERFKKQQVLMEKVCSELEPEKETDPEDVKRKRFETVLDLMQKMQDLGQPPTELVGDVGIPGQGFGAPISAADNAQCSIV